MSKILGNHNLLTHRAIGYFVISLHHNILDTCWRFIFLVTCVLRSAIKQWEFVLFLLTIGWNKNTRKLHASRFLASEQYQEQLVSATACLRRVHMKVATSWQLATANQLFGSPKQRTELSKYLLSENVQLVVLPSAWYLNKWALLQSMYNFNRKRRPTFLFDLN